MFKHVYVIFQVEKLTLPPEEMSRRLQHTHNAILATKCGDWTPIELANWRGHQQSGSKANSSSLSSDENTARCVGSMLAGVWFETWNGSLLKLEWIWQSTVSVMTCRYSCCRGTQLSPKGCSQEKRHSLLTTALQFYRGLSVIQCLDLKGNPVTRHFRETDPTPSWPAVL